jgi:hypothetical protein
MSRHAELDSDRVETEVTAALAELDELLAASREALDAATGANP